MARGIVSWGSKDGAAGELQLWCHKSRNKYCINTRKTAGDSEVVGKDIDVFTLYFRKCTDKIKTFLKRSSRNFISANTENKIIVPCEIGLIRLHSLCMLRGGGRGFFFQRLVFL